MDELEDEEAALRLRLSALETMRREERIKVRDIFSGRSTWNFHVVMHCVQ